MKRAIGIDIGGTKIAVGIISDTGELIERTEVKSDPSNRENMFDRVVEAVEQVLEKSSISIVDIEGIGVGVPGKVHRGASLFFKTIYLGNSFPLRPVYRSDLVPSASRLTRMFIWRLLQNGKRHK